MVVMEAPAGAVVPAAVMVVMERLAKGMVAAVVAAAVVVAFVDHGGAFTLL